MKQSNAPCIGCTIHCYVKNCMGGMSKSVKLGVNTREALSRENDTSVVADSSQQLADTRYYPLIQLVAEMFDNIAVGEDMFMIVGATRNRSSFVVTVKHDGDSTSVYGSSLAALALACQDLL